MANSTPHIAFMATSDAHDAGLMLSAGEAQSLLRVLSAASGVPTGMDQISLPGPSMWIDRISARPPFSFGR